MKKLFARSKSFADIFDLTFEVIKDQFKKMFWLLLFFYSPIIIGQALIQIFAGRGIFRDHIFGKSYFEQFISNLNSREIVTYSVEINGNVVLALAQIVITPLIFASIILIVNKYRNDENYKLRDIVDGVLSRFWPLVGSHLLFFFISVLLIAIPITIIGTTAALSLLSGQSVGAPMMILILTVVIGPLMLLITRWSMYLPISLFDHAPGLSSSYHLTKNRTWMTFWLFLSVFIVTIFITLVFELLSIYTGLSVVTTIILNLVGIFTKMIFSVAYAVIYFDLLVREAQQDS